MNVLALDTSTEILSIALVCDPPGADATRDRTKSEPLPGTYAVTRDVGLKHSRLLMPLIDRLLGDAGLRPSDLDLVACTRGPGSFTGLRIGMATAKGLATSIAAQSSTSLIGPLAILARSRPTCLSVASPLPPELLGGADCAFGLTCPCTISLGRSSKSWSNTSDADRAVRHRSICARFLAILRTVFARSAGCVRICRVSVSMRSPWFWPHFEPHLMRRRSGSVAFYSPSP